VAARASGEIVLVRHGEDRARSECRFADTGLSERGRAQARALAPALAGIDFAHCVCSPLQRARETADLLLAGRPVDVRVDADLAEGSLGDLDGLDREAARARFPEDFRLGESIVARIAASARTAPGGESRDAFIARARRIGARMRAWLEQSAPVLVVGHGGLFSYALQDLVGMPLRDSVPFGFDHCGVLRVLSYAEVPGFGPFPMLRFSSGLGMLQRV
jgi:broad specificity phosphatase PhoE